MKYRDVTLPSGQCFQVPQGIQRIDSQSTHGWQVRYQGTKLFSDGANADPQCSLTNAIAELLARIAASPAQTALKQEPSAGKTSDLPAGISGPIVRNRPGRVPSAGLSVLLPRYGSQAQVRNVYIGSTNTYSPERYLAALEKCIALRSDAMERYERDASKAHRQTLATLKTQLQALRAQGG